MSQRSRFVRLGTEYLHSFRPAIGLSLLLTATCGLSAAATLCVNPGGTGGCKSTISAAVAAAGYRDTILVAGGTYKEQVTITNSVSLIGVNPLNPPVINATGLNNGIFVNGMAAAPGEGVLFVVIKGFEIKNANYEGILVVNGSDITIESNHVHDNNKGLDLSTTPSTCPGIPAFETNEGMDCGEGIHLIGTNRSTLIHNESNKNSGGILITDETGPSSRNVISNNSVHDNPYACGITMASHGPAPALGGAAKASFGVFRNTVEGNDSGHNGLGLPGAGAGVGIFAAIPGYASYENTVINNELHDNGLPGVTMHTHAAFPSPLQPPYLNDNVIIGNHIHGNAADTADATTAGPTGINIYSVVGVHGTVISKNVFENEDIDIAFTVPAGSQLDAHFNNFSASSIGVANLSGGSIIATENWWHCAGGPNGPGSACATASGSLVGGPAPWLLLPFAP
jgi:parallel beta-helix repeat protein